MKRLKKKTIKPAKKTLNSKEHKRLSIIKAQIAEQLDVMAELIEYGKLVNLQLRDINVCKRCDNVIMKRYDRIMDCHVDIVQVNAAVKKYKEPTKNNLRDITALVDRAKNEKRNMELHVRRTFKRCIAVFNSLLDGHIDYRSFSGYKVTRANPNHQLREHMLYMSKFDVMRRFNLTKRQLRGIVDGSITFAGGNITKIGIYEFLNDLRRLVELYTSIVAEGEQTTEMPGE